MVDIKNKKDLGSVWVNEFVRRPIYSYRKITKGKNKGKVEVVILRSYNNFKKLIVAETSVILNEKEKE